VRRLECAIFVLGFAASCSITPGAAAPRLPIGEFTARKIEAPTIDGKVSPGEWDKALTTSGLITPFGHDLQQAETTVAFGFDERNLYFLFVCRRSEGEWHLRKSVRENDDYSFGDPSVEIWVSPPKAIPETYQNVINTYPAVLDQKMIPSRGYVAQGWTGHWRLGVGEGESHYVLEAAVPARDFGLERLEDGSTWRLLLCRTAIGAKPRWQASWSVTQAFSEIPAHPKVHLRYDGLVAQLRNVVSVFTGKPRFAVRVVGPEREDAEAEVSLVWHRTPEPTSVVSRLVRQVKVAAGRSAEIALAGPVPEELRDAKRKGYFTIAVRRKGGAEVFRQSFPFVVNGWAPPPKPLRPPSAPEPEPVRVAAMYGPESDTLVVKTDIIDLPERQGAAGGLVRVLDPARGKRPLLETPLGKFRHWRSLTVASLRRLRIPVVDHLRLARVAEHNAEVLKRNERLIREGKKPEPLWKAEVPNPLEVLVEVTVADAEGKPLRTAAKPVNLLRHKFPWQDNSIGITDEVIPPWTPVRWSDGEVEVWNRKLRLDGLGLLRRISNGGVAQVRSMRLLARVGGRTFQIEPGEPELVRLVPAQADLRGTGCGAGIKVEAHSRLEFDGFTLNRWTIRPEQSQARLDGLFLEVILPEEEASHFCTTAGGWAAVHDQTPAYWSSQKTASGQLIGDFVPYVWLTNSDRAFLWAADNDRGWATDDDRSHPTQEIIRKDGLVTLRVHFVEVPTTLGEPRTVTWAYQTFPSRPLPPGWRATVCSPGRGELLSARHTYFWFDRQADWAVLWPYYCSPYPWSMEKSRKAFLRFPERTRHRPMVGSIAHSIARYRDYEGNEFPGYAVDWGASPGDSSNGNCTQCRGTADFRLYHYQRWVREAGFRGLYVDENYLGVEKNFIEGGAYVRPDGRIQPGYSYLGLREYFKRLKVMFHQNRVPPPNLWQHITSGAAYHAWLGDLFFEGENVEPTDLEDDYLAVLPAARMRAIASARCAGGVMTMMCQSHRHPTIHEPKHTHQFVGWVMAHDVLPEQVRFYEVIAQEGRLYEDNVEFFGYWRANCPARAKTPGCLASVHRAKGRALLWVVNTSREDKEVEVGVSFRRLGLSRRRCVALNAETGEVIRLGWRSLEVAVPRRDFVPVHIVERRSLGGDETFRATFDGRREADEALGCCVFEPEPPALRGGRRGLAADASREFRMWPRLHVSDGAGRLRFLAKLTGADGAVFHTTARRGPRGGPPGPPTIAISVQKGRVVFERFPARRGAADGERIEVPAPEPGWHAFALSWRDGAATLELDERRVGEIRIESLGIAHGIGPAICGSARFAFGGSPAATAIDEVRAGRPLTP